MAMDPAVSGELASLREELSARRRQPATSGSQDRREAKAVASSPPQNAAAGGEQVQELQELIDETIRLVEEAGTTLSTRPVANVIGAFVVGILIGRLLGRRQEF